MISRRNFLEYLALAGGAAALQRSIPAANAATERMYDPQRFGNLSLLQIGDTHAQLNPTHYREAEVNIGLGAEANLPPFLVAEHLLERYRVVPQTLRAHALSPGSFAELAGIYGPTGGYAYLATVIKQLRASRPDSLLLDCGDSFQGSGPALWSRASDMVAATRLLGVDAMSGSGEYSLGADRLAEIFLGELRGQTAFLAHNAPDVPGTRQPARPYAVYFLAGVPVGVIGHAFPYGERFGERFLHPEWAVGVDEAQLQLTVEAVRAKGVRLVVLISQAGLAADIKLASRVQGIDIVLSGRSHDPLPEPIVVPNAAGRTLVSSVGAYGKFCGVLDLELKDGSLRDYRFNLIPIFSNLIAPDPEMDALIRKYRVPFGRQLDVKLADNEALLYRRGNFASSTDQLILNAMLAARDAQIAFTPGFRWGTTILPGEDITVERLLEQTAVWDSGMRVETLSGAVIRQRLETWLTDTFNPDPYLRSGEDMVRVAGLSYRCNPAAENGARVSEVLVGGKPLNNRGTYRTVSWGLPGSVPSENEPIWTVVADYLKQIKTVRPLALSKPRLDGVDSNRGYFELG
ncbi:MAG TPA: thiosulfohydrolase SoxB [Rhodocyclaceae bacterium]|nr:thiosulfohydrolase SoxB [Rhodocyclaceae bacterium]